MPDRNRVQKGVSTGGQFAAESRAEDASIVLASKPVSPVKLDTHRTRTVPISFNASFSLNSSGPLPELPLSMRGSNRPRVDYQMNNGVVETSVEYGGETVDFWEDSGDRLNSVLVLYNDSEPWPELDDEDREALVEWSEAVHDRIDTAVYGASVQMSMNDEWSKTLTREAVRDHGPEEYDERSHEMDQLIGRYQEAARTAAAHAAKATSARDALMVLRKHPDAHEARFDDASKNTMNLYDGDDNVVASNLPVRWTGDSRLREDIMDDEHGSYNLRDAANWRPARF